MDNPQIHKLVIRKELVQDQEAVFLLVKEAFLNDFNSDHKEQFLVERLRKSVNFIPELSLVAILEEQVVGYILLTKAHIKSGNEIHETLALAPLAVLPDQQARGIGSELMKYAHQKALELGYNSIVLIGHQDYYPKFGYQQAHKYGISFPFDVPKMNCFAVELKKGGLDGVQGEVVYAQEFFEG